MVLLLECPAFFFYTHLDSLVFKTQPKSHFLQEAFSDLPNWRLLLSPLTPNALDHSTLVTFYYIMSIHMLLPLWWLYYFSQLFTFPLCKSIINCHILPHDFQYLPVEGGYFITSLLPVLVTWFALANQMRIEVIRAALGAITVSSVLSVTRIACARTKKTLGAEPKLTWSWWARNKPFLL